MKIPSPIEQLRILEAAKRNESTETQPAYLLCWGEACGYVERVRVFDGISVPDAMKLTTDGDKALRNIKGTL